MTIRDRLSDREISVGLGTLGIGWVLGSVVTVLSLPRKALKIPGETIRGTYSAAYLPISETMILVPLIVFSLCAYGAYSLWSVDDYYSRPAVKDHTVNRDDTTDQRGEQ